MTAHAPTRAQPVAAAPSSRLTARPDRLIVGALVLLSLALRAPNLGRAYWVDEGISVGIASHPLRQLPSLLHKDGSPPLFYAILHGWIRLFGTSPLATHALPLLISLAAVPLAYWAGRTFYDRGAGLVAAALFATSPFLNWYSTETRMYPLVVVLATVGLALAWRGFRDRSWKAAAGAVAAYAALLYTHNWAVYLTAVTAAVLLGLAVSRRDKQLAYGVAVSSVAVIVLWLPWLPTFLAQANNTAAPWAVRPGMGDFFADPVSALGGTLGVVVAPLLAVGALATYRFRSTENDHVAGLLGGIGALALLAGFIGAQLEPSWTIRYLAVIVAPFLLGLTGALATTLVGRAVAVSACAILATWSIVGTLLPNANSQYAKSNVAAVARAAAPDLRPGDVVVVTQTEQVPVLAHYLPAGLRYVVPTGPVRDPLVVDWRNILARLHAARPCATVAPSIDALPLGASVLVVDPSRSLGANGTSWSQVVNAQVQGVETLLASDPALVAVDNYQEALKPRPFAPVDAVLYRKTSTASACA